MLRFSHALNNYESLNITKLDVLSEESEIRIGVNYKLNGRALPAGYMPASLDELAQCEVEYETMPGWKCDISKAKTTADLPPQAVAYLKRIEQLVGVPISYVGVGASRDAMISM